VVRRALSGVEGAAGEDEIDGGGVERQVSVVSGDDEWRVRWRGCR
jgi:hypothetical protein